MNAGNAYGKDIVREAFVKFKNDIIARIDLFERTLFQEKNNESQNEQNDETNHLMDISHIQCQEFVRKIRTHFARGAHYKKEGMIRRFRSMLKDYGKIDKLMDQMAIYLSTPIHQSQMLSHLGLILNSDSVNVDKSSLEGYEKIIDMFLKAASN